MKRSTAPLFLRYAVANMTKRHFGGWMRGLIFSFVFLALVGSGAGQQPNYTIQQYLGIRSASAPVFSPDSRSIAYLSNASGTTQIWTLTLGTKTPKQITNYDDNVGFVRWLNDGTILFGKAKGGD